MLLTISSSEGTPPRGRIKCRARQRPTVRGASLLLLLLCLELILTTVSAGSDANRYLKGVGYREQELQTSKQGKHFNSEEATGVDHVSFGGGTNVFIRGVGLDPNPQSNLINLISEEFGHSVPAPPLTEDDAFGSHPQLGVLTYKLPSLQDLFNMPEKYFIEHEVLTFHLTLSVSGMKTEPMICPKPDHCKIVYKRTYTPVFHYLSPRVVYDGALTDVWFDPKSISALTDYDTLESDEKPFINFKLDESLLDFTGRVDYRTRFYGYYMNYARGEVDQLPNGNHDTRMTWEVGYAYNKNVTAVHCNYEETDCYMSKTVPVIKSLSSQTGYTTGGQLLEIEGFGFTSGNISAKIEGNDCEVQSYDSESFTCVVGAAEAESSTDTPIMGQHGLSVFQFKHAKFDDSSYTHRFLRTEFEAYKNSQYQDGQISKAWFIAPDTKRYRFYMACDDACSLHFSKLPNDVTNSEKIIEILSNSGGRMRDYYTKVNENGDFTQISDWVDLEKGKAYYIEARHIEHSGSDHMTVAVEIEAGRTTPHHSPMFETQKVSWQAETVFEKTLITVKNIEKGGKYSLLFVDPVDPTETVSVSDIPKDWTVTGEKMRELILSYYTERVESNIWVSLQKYDANNALIDDALTEEEVMELTPSVTFQYEIEVLKLRDGSSVGSIVVDGTGVDILLPVDHVMSLQPNKGRMRVKCVDEFGNEAKSQEFFPHYSDAYIAARIMKGCPYLTDMVQVRSVNRFNYTENGKELWISFQGYKGKLGQFELELDSTNILYGMGGQTKIAEKIFEYNPENIFFEPIPFEMLKTFETTPQIEVSVDGFPAVCMGLKCNFTYTAPTSEVQSFTYTSATKKLEITGVNLPTTEASIHEITFAKTPCVVDPSSLSSTGVTCTLETDPVCGSYHPEYFHKLGLIPVADSLAKEDIACTISSVHPDTNLNLMGGDNLTFTGTNFPRKLEGSTFELAFDNGDSTPCTVQSSTATEFVCLTGKFGAAMASQTVGMAMTINGAAVSSSLTLSLRDSLQAVQSFTPTSMSPVLKRRMAFTLDTAFPETLTKDSLTVNLTGVEDPKYIRYLKVISVDDAAKTFEVMFGGARSGKFNIHIRHQTYGLIDCTASTLDVSSEVTAVSINEISPFGGTFLTITGTNFGSEATDNPVQISYNGGVGSTDCFVKEISSTQIKCRVNTGISKEAGSIATLVVFLKTSEEAKCDSATTCRITFTSNNPTVTAVETFWDTTDKINKIRVTGTGFTGTASDVSLFVAGVFQTTKTVSTTQAVFALDQGVPKHDITGLVEMYFDKGVPTGHALLKETSLVLEPHLISVSPNKGSFAAGSILIATIEGIGFNQTDINLKSDSGHNVCQAAQVIGKNLLRCETALSQEIPANSELMTLISTGTTFSCANADITKCLYEQIDGAAFPAVSTISKTSSSTLVVTGTHFDFESSFSPMVSIGANNASSIVLDSPTQMTATFDLGVPVTQGEAVPKVFYFQDAGQAHFAVNTQGLSNPVAIASSSSGLECSFAGGCFYKIGAPGLSSVAGQSPKENFLSVCGSRCSFEKSKSTGDEMTCRLPAISTVYSNANFGVEKETHDLDSGMYFGTSKDAPILWDKDITIELKDSSDECIAGMEFKETHVGVLSQVKYFMGDIDDKLLYAGHLRFQASADNSTWTNLFWANVNIHTGWNYVNWDTEDEKPKYRFYRFYSNMTNGCNMREVAFRGIETIQDTGSSYTCTPKLFLGGSEAAAILNPVTFKGSLTPALTKVEPRFGSVEGGDVLTFTGVNFPTDHTKITAKIDGVACVVSASTSTTFQCTTGPRIGLVLSSLEIFVEGQGRVSNQEVVFTYVNKWSSDSTWGGEFAPMEDETLFVPEGLNLLMDIDSPPVLKVVVVEGSLIFPPDADENHMRTFDANYIFINKGKMEVGTEEHPYTSKLNITMHSKISDPYLPIYGNKVIGLRFGTLDLHGVKREPTWTSLQKTANAGESQLTLQGEIDWKEGEWIAIASTSYYGRDAEERQIVSVDRTIPSKPKITLDKPLKHRHVGVTDYYGGTERPDDFIDLRAEVGLLTRNVVFRGNPKDSESTQYGANMFLHSEGDESLKARIENIELHMTGQAFKIGRYSIHFHMIGTVYSSYVRGISVHRSYNRMVTLHAIKYLTIENNVGYDIMGHAIFMEDGVERKNLIKDNCIINVKRSMSLLNTDQTPAAFWMTNPDNNVVGNHAAGSDRYGFWYDLQVHAIGPSANTDICPENERLGENRNNHAHSMGRYGLRIFHNMVSREHPCENISFDRNRQDDPYHANRPITNNFYNFTGWMNGRNGAVAKDVGDIRFHDFKCADNLLAGVEISLPMHYAIGEPQVRGGLFVGRSSINTEGQINDASPNGIITARYENFAVDGSHFYNYNWNKAAVFGTCSHCIIMATRDDGARQHNVSSLYVDPSTVKLRIVWTIPYKAIFFDKDGTLSGTNLPTWITKYHNHHNLPECKRDTVNYDDAAVCDRTHPIRRITWFSFIPYSNFQEQIMYILPYDDEIVGGMTPEELEAYEANRDNYGAEAFNKVGKPGASHAPAIVTGHKYKVHWGVGVDFEEITVLPSQNFEPTDESIYLIHNFTDRREVLDFMKNKATLKVDNESLPLQDWKTKGINGQNIVYNDTATRRMHFLVNGRDKEYPLDIHSLRIIGKRCVGECLETTDDKQTEDKVRRWSDPANWPNEQLPKEGDDVMVLSEWDMLYDLEDSPVYGKVEIQGILTFEDTADRKINAKSVFVRGGDLFVGTKETPFQHEAVIQLHGKRNDETLAISNTIFAGNKVLANVGKVHMYGKSRGGSITRLKHVAPQGSTEIRVEPWMDIQAGDMIGLVSQTYDVDKSDSVTVKSYDSKSGLIVLEKPTRFYHWGQHESTASKYGGVDIRCEVILFSRNVKIVGAPGNVQGCTVVTADIYDFTKNGVVQRHGQMIIDNVEIYNCSQKDLENAAIRFEQVKKLESSVTNCAIHHGLGWGAKVLDSWNVIFRGNSIFSFTRIGITYSTVKNCVLDNNIIGHILFRIPDEPRGGVLGCTQLIRDQCTDLSIVNNIVAGATFSGFATRAHDCGEHDTQQVFRNNTAHSIEDIGGGYGVFIEKDPLKLSHSMCIAGSHFNVYKCTHQGLATYQQTKQVRINNVNSFDNQRGFTAAMFTKQDEYRDYKVLVEDSTFYGESEIEDCHKVGDLEPGFCHTPTKFALINAQVTENGKPTNAIICELPFYKQWSAMSWNLKVVYNRVKFKYFKPTTRYGQKQAVLMFNDMTWDVIFIHEFYDSQLHDVQEGSLAWLRAPPQEWAILEVCGNFPCTGPLNAWFNFQRTSYFGLKPRDAHADFQIISNNEGLSPYIPTCRKNIQMNAYICQQEKLGLVMFESLDYDRLDRASQPIYVTMQGTKIRSKLNAFKDHNWDGFYNKQERLQRFPALVYAPKGAVYEITYTGSPAENQTYKLMAVKKNIGVTVRIAYPSAEARQIRKTNGEYILMNQWDERINNYGVIKQRFCGENRYIGVKNILEFYLNSGCEIKIKPRNAIQTMVRMEWSMEEFFADGGTTKFIDRLAGSLGIHASTIKVVSVYQGSLVVNYEIETSTPEALTAVQDRQTKKFASGDLNLGAPILDTVVGDLSVISDGVVTAPGFKPIVITQTETNQDFSSTDVFNPDVNITFQNETTTKVKQDTIYLNGTSESESHIVYQEIDNTISTVIITAAVMFLFFMIIIGCIKYYSYQKEKDLLDAKIIREKHTQFESQAKDGHFALTQNSKVELSAAKDYEDQYDPTQDFVVFGNPGKGKMVSKLKENEADIVRKQAGKTLKIPASENSSAVDCASPGLTGSNSPAQLLTPTTGSLKAPLPEDQEIVDSEVLSRQDEK